MKTWYLFIRAEVENHSNHYLMKGGKQYLSKQTYKYFYFETLEVSK